MILSFPISDLKFVYYIISSLEFLFFSSSHSSFGISCLLLIYNCHKFLWFFWKVIMSIQLKRVGISCLMSILNSYCVLGLCFLIASYSILTFFFLSLVDFSPLLQILWNRPLWNFCAVSANRMTRWTFPDMTVKTINWV